MAEEHLQAVGGAEATTASTRQPGLPPLTLALVISLKDGGGASTHAFSLSRLPPSAIRSCPRLLATALLASELASAGVACINGEKIYKTLWNLTRSLSGGEIK